jgi:hypothetical protein
MIDSVVLQLCYVSGDVDDSHFEKSTRRRRALVTGALNHEIPPRSRDR